MHFLDKGTRGKVLGLRVRCSKDGCDWEGELGDLERHFSNKCLYVEEVCPHGCGQSYPRHLLQSHQLDECPQRPLQLQLETVDGRLTQKYELLQQQLLEYLEQEKKHEEDKKELQETLIQQEMKHKEDKNELQQQLAQQEKKHEELQQKLEDQNQKLLQNIVLQEKQENEKHQQLLNQEKKHEIEKVLQQQLNNHEKKHKQGNKKWIFVVLVVVFGAWLLQEMENTSQQLRQIAERNVELKQQLTQQERKHEELQQQLIHQEKKHDQDKQELQQQLSLIQQLTSTNNALTLHPVGSIGPCDVCLLVDCMLVHCK